MLSIALDNKKGFTLIELVIVIVLIGILAATALPKFANLTTQARTASNQGVAGGLGAAVSIAHAAWIAKGATGAGTINIENTTVSVNANGWPDGGGGLSPSITQCQTIWTAVLNNPPESQQSAGACGTNSCYVITATPANSCTFTLYAGSPATAVSPVTNITYNATTGTVGLLP